MTPEQFDQQQQLLSSILDAVKDGVVCCHVLIGVSTFLVHLQEGVLWLLLAYGIVAASQRRRKGD